MVSLTRDRSPRLRPCRQTSASSAQGSPASRSRGSSSVGLKASCCSKEAASSSRNPLRNLPTVLRRHTLSEQALAGGPNAGQPYYPLRFTRCARSAARRGHGTKVAAFRSDHSTQSISRHETACRRPAGRSTGPSSTPSTNEPSSYAVGPVRLRHGDMGGARLRGAATLDPKLVQSVIFQFGKRKQLRPIRGRLGAGRNVNLVLTPPPCTSPTGRAHGPDGLCDAVGQPIQRPCTDVHPRCGGDRECSSAAGLEDSQSAGIGNGCDLVGRSFMEHPDVAVGYPDPRSAVRQKGVQAVRHQHAGEHLTVEAMFRLSDAVLRSKRLLNAVMRLRGHLPVRHDVGRAIGRGRPKVGASRGLRRRGWPRHALRSILERTTDPPPLRHLSLRAPTGGHYSIDMMAEQGPTTSSRVRLARRRDRLGVPWRFSIGG